MDNEKRNLTVFGSETEFNGVLEFSDELVITGKFTGTITSKGVLTIDKHAECEVDSITADTVIVAGKVTGNINAPEHVEMCTGSTVKGDVITARLRIAENVNFEGNVTMLEEEPEKDLFSTSSEEFKNSLNLKTNHIE